jgi:hypothetical protein
MHHKFLVFCGKAEGDLEHRPRLIPTAVWTGSLNPTVNGARSFENAVFITSDEVAQAYAREHRVLLALSEPLNWSEAYVSPEYWIGS